MYTKNTGMRDRHRNGRVTLTDVTEVTEAARYDAISVLTSHDVRLKQQVLLVRK